MATLLSKVSRAFRLVASMLLESVFRKFSVAKLALCGGCKLEWMNSAENIGFAAITGNFEIVISLNRTIDGRS